MGGALRCLAIARRIGRNLPHACVLALTDLPIFGRFELPPNFDYVHIPWSTSEDDGNELMPRLRSSSTATRLRRTIAETSIEAFDPDWVILDGHPLGVGGELRPALEALRSRRPELHLVAGLPDLVGEPSALRAQWDSTGVLKALDSLFDEVWVYGSPDVFDAASSYALPAAVERKLAYMGYLRDAIDHEVPDTDFDVDPTRPLVLVSAGSGRSGHRLMDAYLGFLEQSNGDCHFQSHLVCGPCMPAAQYQAVEQRGRRMDDVQVSRFQTNLRPHLQMADVVVSTFGYNICCEVLSFSKPSIVSPDESLAPGQLLRARTMADRGLIDLVEPAALGPERLGSLVLARLDEPRPLGSHGFAFDGLDNIAGRLLGGSVAPL
jgi:predicted glycosyltransferase